MQVTTMNNDLEVFLIFRTRTSLEKLLRLQSHNIKVCSGVNKVEPGTSKRITSILSPDMAKIKPEDKAKTKHKGYKLTLIEFIYLNSL